MSCSGECRGARAAEARFNRKKERLKKMGKKTRNLENWRNYSYQCTCQDESVSTHVTIVDNYCVMLVSWSVFFFPTVSLISR